MGHNSLSHGQEMPCKSHELRNEVVEELILM